MRPEQDTPLRMDRRQFLMLAAAALATGCQTAREGGAGSTMAQGQRVVDAGPVSRYAADGVYDRFRDEGFFLVRQGDKLFALSSFCTHRKCKLTAEPDHSFYCHCHGSTFDPNGKVEEGPARRNLPALPSFTNAAGELFVRVPNL